MRNRPARRLSRATPYGAVGARNPKHVRGGVFVQHTGEHEQVVRQPVEVIAGPRIDVRNRDDRPLRAARGDARHMGECGRLGAAGQNETASAAAAPRSSAPTSASRRPPPQR